jgi:MraZ protein
MLLGEHEHSLDDKNRLTLPAKLRAAFEDGVVVTRGLDGCLYAYPRPAWEQLADRIKSLDPLAEGSRVMQRHFFAGASEATHAGSSQKSPFRGLQVGESGVMWGNVDHAAR